MSTAAVLTFLDVKEPTLSIALSNISKEGIFLQSLHSFIGLIIVNTKVVIPSDNAEQMIKQNQYYHPYPNPIKHPHLWLLHLRIRGSMS